MTAKDLSTFNDSTCSEVLHCSATGRPYKITIPELRFYQQTNLPLPHKHPDQRHRERLALRNPRQLWQRQCSKCSATIETTYHPERPERIYCEKCYADELY